MSFAFLYDGEAYFLMTASTSAIQRAEMRMIRWIYRKLSVTDKFKLRHR